MNNKRDDYEKKQDNIKLWAYLMAANPHNNF